MGDWGEIKSNWDDKTTFVEKHASSSKIIDLTYQHNLLSDIKFEIIKTINLEIPLINNTVFCFTTKAISLLDVIKYIERTNGIIEEAIFYFYTINDKAANYTCELAKR